MPDFPMHEVHLLGRKKWPRGHQPHLAQSPQDLSEQWSQWLILSKSGYWIAPVRAAANWRPRGPITLWAAAAQSED
jgi:hypothetical protein